jgi:hypothetical protein
MSLGKVKIIYAVACVALGLIILGPTLALVIGFPGGELFSELYLLGSDRLAEGYPFNVTDGVNYNISVGVVNHLGSLGYYVVYVKLRNQTDTLPNSTAGTPSTLEPLCEYRLILRDSQPWERNVSFSLRRVAIEGASCRVGSFSVENAVFNVEKATAWDETNHVFFFELFFELWLYNATSSTLEFNNRFVGVWLNVTGDSS